MRCSRRASRAPPAREGARRGAPDQSLRHHSGAVAQRVRVRRWRHQGHHREDTHEAEMSAPPRADMELSHTLIVALFSFTVYTPTCAAISLLQSYMHEAKHTSIDAKLCATWSACKSRMGRALPEITMTRGHGCLEWFIDSAAPLPSTVSTIQTFLVI